MSVPDNRLSRKRSRDSVGVSTVISCTGNRYTILDSYDAATLRSRLDRYIDRPIMTIGQYAHCMFDGASISDSHLVAARVLQMVELSHINIIDDIHDTRLPTRV